MAVPQGNITPLPWGVGRMEPYPTKAPGYSSVRLAPDTQTATFSRRVVGWSIDASPTAALTTNALAMAIGNRSPLPGGTIIHSDRGVQFGSWAFTQRARASGLLPSMGSIGDCVDDAMMESFWARVQVELLNRRRWRTRMELSTALFEYLEIFHNRQRRYSALGMLSLVEYELRTPPVA
jgi:transposase InsO family protein